MPCYSFSFSVFNALPTLFHQFFFKKTYQFFLKKLIVTRGNAWTWTTIINTSGNVLKIVTNKNGVKPLPYMATYMLTRCNLW